MNAASNRKNQLLSQQRCYHHRDREAVVRCPECGRYFCRECVTEHGQRMLCSTCLAKSRRRGPAGERSWLSAMHLLLQGCLGFLVIWYAFYLMGLILLAIPDAFHEGTVWETGWWNNQ